MSLSVPRSAEPVQERKSDEEIRSANPGSQSLPQTMFPLYCIEGPGVAHLTASGAVRTPGPSILITADQLPAWADVLGVPRELIPGQAMNLSSWDIAPKEESIEVASLPAPLTPSSEMDAVVKLFATQDGQSSSGRSALSGRSGEDTEDNNINAGGARGVVSDRPLMSLHPRLASPMILSTRRESPYPVMYATWSYMTRGNVQRGQDAAVGPAERFLTTSSSLPLRPRGVVESTPLMSLPSHRSPSFSSSSTSTAATKGRNTHADQHDPADRKVGNTRKKNKKGNNGASSAGKTGKPAKPKAICYEWNRRGTCEYGKACRYRHETSQRPREFRNKDTKVAECLPQLAKRQQGTSEDVQDSVSPNHMHQLDATNKHASPGVGKGSDGRTTTDISSIYSDPIGGSPATAPANMLIGSDPVQRTHSQVHKTASPSAKSHSPPSMLKGGNKHGEMPPPLRRNQKQQGAKQKGQQPRGRFCRGSAEEEEWEEQAVKARPVEDKGMESPRESREGGAQRRVRSVEIVSLLDF